MLLPSALNVPQSGPSTLAEYAPVPGAGRGQSDVSDLGQGSSGGLGFGAGSGSRAGIPPERLGSPSQKRGLRNKRCVGNPPRQTEDLLSPPCVAFFDGDNGGATTKGVTRDEVTVVLFTPGTAPGDEPSFVDCLALTSTADRADDLHCKAYARYFNDRFQTYGRTVHVWMYHSRVSSTGTISVEQEVINIDDLKHPFAINAAGTTIDTGVAQSAAKRKIFGVAYRGSPRSFYSTYAPFFIGFKPDTEDRIKLSAGYVCKKLAGRPAQFSGNVDDRLRERKFGYLTPSGHVSKKIMDSEMKAMCGLEVNSASTIRSTASASADIAPLKADSVTTVIMDEDTQGNATIGAAQNGWFPEWFLPANSESNSAARGYNQAEWRNAFGIATDYRRDLIREQAWYRAYKEGCPNCPEPSDPSTSPVYDTFNMLFWGIQAAGPRLTPENLDKGLHAIPASGSPSPYKPSAYFAPGNYTFLKDAMEIWWDPQGQAPGDPQPGCYRLPNEGQRFRGGEWKPGDGDIQNPGAPCQGSARAAV